MVVVWQAVEMSYSIAAATIAALKRFTESLNTGFGHGELMRVHGQSQGYEMSDRSGSLKDSRNSKPSVSSAPVPDTTNRHGFHTTPIRNSDYQQLNLRPENLHNEVTVASLSKRSVVEEKPVQTHCEGDNIIRHDVRYSVHYEENHLVSEGLEHLR